MKLIEFLALGTISALLAACGAGLLSDRARVRALHAAPAASTVDAYLLQGSQTLASAAPTVSALSYGNSNPAPGRTRWNSVAAPTAWC